MPTEWEFRKKFEGIGCRCGHGNYSGVIRLLSLDELKYLWIRDSADKMKLPVLDRINVDGNYSIGNCRYIENVQNISRSRWAIGKIRSCWGKMKNKKKSITVRADAAQISKIKKIAKSDGRTLFAQITRMLDAALALEIDRQMEIEKRAREISKQNKLLSLQGSPINPTKDEAAISKATGEKA